MIKTRVCEILNIQYPIVQGTVSRGTVALSAAVSEAGADLHDGESPGVAHQRRD
ncbi:MAG: hypothetical protein HW384_1030, partial [Dehalococcoidia bacterium]|nr:hypothetical protein [Dehalococcoidia bacterium]